MVTDFDGNPIDCGSSTSWPRPIPVTERLPGDGKVVLAWGSLPPWRNMSAPGRPWQTYEPEWHWARLSGGSCEFATAMGYESEPLVDVTHWLPLPPAPSAE